MHGGVAGRTSDYDDVVANLERVVRHLGRPERSYSIPLGRVDRRIDGSDRDENVRILELDPLNLTLHGNVLIEKKIRVRVVGVYNRAK
jgi:hypothetical protein